MRVDQPAVVDLDRIRNGLLGFNHFRFQCRFPLSQPGSCLLDLSRKLLPILFQAGPLEAEFRDGGLNLVDLIEQFQDLVLQDAGRHVVGGDLRLEDIELAVRSRFIELAVEILDLRFGALQLEVLAIDQEACLLEFVFPNLAIGIDLSQLIVAGLHLPRSTDQLFLNLFESQMQLMQTRQIDRRRHAILLSRACERDQLASAPGNRIIRITHCGCNSVGRVTASQAVCRGFESLHPLSANLLENPVNQLAASQVYFVCYRWQSRLPRGERGRQVVKSPVFRSGAGAIFVRLAERPEIVTSLNCG